MQDSRPLTGPGAESIRAAKSRGGVNVVFMEVSQLVQMDMDLAKSSRSHRVARTVACS
jgi:hypothetical protein